MLAAGAQFRDDVLIDRILGQDKPLQLVGIIHVVLQCQRSSS
jgi:hypothetical protein